MILKELTNFINISLFGFKKNIEHFKEHCPVEARDYFKKIILKLESIENRLDRIEKKTKNN